MAIIYQDVEIEIEQTRFGEYILRNRIAGVVMRIELNSRSITARVNTASGSFLRTEAKDGNMLLQASN